MTRANRRRGPGFPGAPARAPGAADCCSCPAPSCDGVPVLFSGDATRPFGRAFGLAWHSPDASVRSLLLPDIDLRFADGAGRRLACERAAFPVPPCSQPVGLALALAAEVVEHPGDLWVRGGRRYPVRHAPRLNVGFGRLAVRDVALGLLPLRALHTSRLCWGERQRGLSSPHRRWVCDRRGSGEERRRRRRRRGEGFVLLRLLRSNLL